MMWPRAPTAMRFAPCAATSSSRLRAASGATHASSAAGARHGSPASSAASASRRTPRPAGSAHATSLELARLVVGRGSLDGEVVTARLLVLQAERQVAPVAEIHHRLESGPQGRHVVELHRVAFLHAVQLAAAVIA